MGQFPVSKRGPAFLVRTETEKNTSTAPPRCGVDPKTAGEFALGVYWPATCTALPMGMPWVNTGPPRGPIPDLKKRPRIFSPYRNKKKPRHVGGTQSLARNLRAPAPSPGSMPPLQQAGGGMLVGHAPTLASFFVLIWPFAAPLLVECRLGRWVWAVHARACVRACVCACVRACVRVCVRACVRACMRA